MRRTVASRIAAVVLYSAIAIDLFTPFYFRIFFTDRDRLARSFAELPFRRTPGLRTLMEEVRRRTPPDARIALWVPMLEWGNGYAYAYYRASFLLAGRDVLPLIDDKSRPLPDSLSRAEYLVMWGGTPQLTGFERLWGDDRGSLWRRQR